MDIISPSNFIPAGGELLLRSSHLRASWVSRCFRPALLSLLWGAVAVASTGAGVGTCGPCHGKHRVLRGDKK